MARDWVAWPELRNRELEFYYFQSPHKQITADFRAKVVKVHDADTITVDWYERDFIFPVRLLGTNAPELSEDGGHEAQKWLEGLLLNEEVEILINPRQRVGKWGRILGTIIHKGININEESIREGWATTFEARREGKIPRLDEVFR